MTDGALALAGRLALPFAESPKRRRSSGRHRNRTVTIIDWDDTLLPSHEIFTSGNEKIVNDPSTIDATFRKYLDEIEDRALKLLQRSLTHGLVIVVTASEAGWVERSGSACLPRVLAFFRKHSIRVISARSRYERHCGPNDWKVRAFHDEIKQMFYTKNGVHVVVIGDGFSEWLAARSLKDTYSGMVVKTIKLQEAPNAQQLAYELSLLETSIESIFDHQESFEYAYHQESFEFVLIQ